jgi:glycosyltransferase involved in cell wall biosynthesis
MSPRPKLVYLVTEDWYFVSHRLPLAVAAREAGYDVTVVTQAARHADVIRAAGFALEPVLFNRSGLHPVSEARTVAALTAIYRRVRPDIVHHVALKPVVYGAIAAKGAGVRGIVNALMGLGYVFTSETAKARALRPFVRRALHASLGGPHKRLIVQNRDDLAAFTETGVVDKAHVRLIRGSGVDPMHYTTDPPPAGVPLVVLPARLLRDKGVIEFVDAARQLLAEGVSARFALVGDPDPVNPASLAPSDIAAWVREGVIEHWGWRSDMPAVLAQATVVCLPSYREGLPKALLEAAASTRAMVATDVPGCREIVRPDETGWLVPARDAALLAGALRKALARPDLRAHYAAAARQLVEAELSEARIVAETLAVYAELSAV